MSDYQALSPTLPDDENWGSFDGVSFTSGYPIAAEAWLVSGKYRAAIKLAIGRKVYSRVGYSTRDEAQREAERKVNEIKEKIK